MHQNLMRFELKNLYSRVYHSCRAKKAPLSALIKEIKKLIQIVLRLLSQISFVKYFAFGKVKVSLKKNLKAAFCLHSFTKKYKTQTLSV